MEFLAFHKLSVYLSAIAQMEGAVVSIAAGNEGNSRHHYESTMLLGVGKEIVDLNVGPNEKGLYLEFWETFPIPLD
jgi:hypothetical protein